jgi:hypothetical protein
VAEPQELDGPSTAPRGEAGVGAGGIGVGLRARVGVGDRVGSARLLRQAEHAVEPVERKGAWSDRLGKPALSDQPRELELHEAVLRMHEAQREPQVALVRRPDMRDAESVAHDLDRRFEACGAQRALRLRQAGAQIDEARTRDGDGQQDEARENSADPAQGLHRAHVMLTMTVFLVVKCSSIASSVASLPRPDVFTPP